MGQRITHGCKLLQIVHILIVEYSRRPTAAKRLIKLNFIWKLIHQASMQKRRQKILDKTLAQENRRYIISVHKRRTSLDPSIVSGRSAEQHGPPSVLITQIIQVVKSLYFAEKIVVQVLQQEPHDRDIGNIREEIVAGARFAIAENGGGFHGYEEAAACITILGRQ